MVVLSYFKSFTV